MMKRGLWVLAAALLAGIVAFCAMRWHHGAGHNHGGGIALDGMPELAWLKSDLQLTDQQFAKVSELHAAYRPKCVEMCRRISEAHDKIEKFAAENNQVSPDYRSALKEHAEIHVQCQEEMLKHLYETAATLGKDQADRYLKTMLPFALDFSHSETGNLHAR